MNDSSDKPVVGGKFAVTGSAVPMSIDRSAAFLASMTTRLRAMKNSDALLLRAAIAVRQFGFTTL